MWRSVVQNRSRAYFSSVNLQARAPTTMLMSKLGGLAMEVALAAPLVLFLPAYYVYKLTTSLLSSVFPEDVSGKVVLITGASSGIGEHLAYEYAKRGAYLALVARREASLGEVADNASALGAPGVLVLPADVSKPDDCQKFVNDTVAYFGRLDHLVNNASIWQVCRFEEVEDVNNFRTLMDINFWGHVYPTRHAIPHLKRTHGRIVGVTSNSSYIFIGRNSFYNASKAAVLNFYDTLRMELGGDVHITEIIPGVVESEITKGKMLTKEGKMKVDQDQRDAVLGPTPAEPVALFAKRVVRDVCRGARYVFEPRWYLAVYMFRVFFPDILAWNSRLLTVDSVGPATTDTLGKTILDMPGVRWFTQPASLQTPETPEIRAG
ncbi:11-beta-hydroxysteroid dehydrogenase 1A-like [Lolium perenne]|uniref:11-beta-hydroxysteroid dehydrogenase 1A-like n=1 Tax=Lolium perenne TaxID=4522 RepID=UPI003A98FEA1